VLDIYAAFRGTFIFFFFQSIEVIRFATPFWRELFNRHMRLLSSSIVSTKLGSNKGGAHLIDVSHLNHIVSVDLEAMTITAEPAVNMGEITHLLVPQGLALLCQVEMESLTIGGLSMGLGMETNSHTCGFFQETVVAYEIVTATSPPERRIITKESDPDTFYALPWSVGTLGFLASVTVKIVKTKPFVKMTYTMTRSAEELTRVMTELSEADDKAPTFLEATVYSAKTAVVQCGEFVDAPQSKEEKAMVNGINWWFKKFYFRHLWDLLDETKADGSPKYETYTEIIPLMHCKWPSRSLPPSLPLSLSLFKSFPLSAPLFAYACSEAFCRRSFLSQFIF
jgi:delta24-sterol reductase